MVGKPCRNDLESSNELSQHLATLCSEEQLYQKGCTCVSRECWTSPSWQQERGKHHLLYLLEWAPCCLGPQGLLERKGSKHLSSGLFLFLLIPAPGLQRHCKDKLCVFFLMIKLPSSELKVFCMSVWVFFFIGYLFLLPNFSVPTLKPMAMHSHSLYAAHASQRR